MVLKIKTTAKSCHIAVNIKIHKHSLLVLSLTDNDEKSVQLQPKVKYRFEWFVIANKKDANAKILATVTPDNAGFLPLTIDHNYNAGDQDGNVFLFTLK